jgi:exosome complex RNA-binding protein Rrp4
MLLGNNGKPWLNDSGCHDPTAYEAMKRIQKEEWIANQTDRNARLVITTIKNILDLSGFELVERIQIRHNKSGKIFR